MANKQLLNKINKAEAEKEKLQERILSLQSELSGKEEYLKKLYDIKKREEKLEQQLEALGQEVAEA